MSPSTTDDEELMKHCKDLQVALTIGHKHYIEGIDLYQELKIFSQIIGEAKKKDKGKNHIVTALKYITDNDLREFYPDIKVSIFLRETLNTEKLSDHAESCRKKLLQKLDFRESSPQAYIDMNGPPKGNNKMINIQSQISECYEEVDRRTPDKERRCSEPVTFTQNNNKSNLSINNTYNNIETVISEMFLNKDIRPDVPMKKSIVERNSLPNSIVNSNRNSVSSFKKDSPDRISTSSSIVPDTVTNLLSSSSTTSSTRSGDDNSEVLTMSASAVRYSAVKYGTLSKKEKFLFVDIMKQYWAALLGQIIYIYTSEKDNKPCLEINVTGYQARPVELRDSNNKKDCSFEVFSPGKRTFQFTAQTRSEMEHWISVICQAGKVPEILEPVEPVINTKEPVRQLPSIPMDLMYDHPDSVIRPVSGGNQHHQVYEMMQEPGEDVYHYIEHDTPNGKDKGIIANESSLYKNIDVPLKGCNEEDNMYYNLIPCPDSEEDREEECIYDVISEKHHHVPERISPVVSTKVPPTVTAVIVNSTKTTIRNETEKLTKPPAPAMSSRPVIIQDEIYELVN